MAHVISDECIMCGACESTCPVGAIAEGDGKYVIDADACIDCGACEDGCPVGAISAEQSLIFRHCIAGIHKTEQSQKGCQTGTFIQLSDSPFSVIQSAFFFSGRNGFFFFSSESLLPSQPRQLPFFLFDTDGWYYPGSENVSLPAPPEDA